MTPSEPSRVDAQAPGMLRNKIRESLDFAKYMFGRLRWELDALDEAAIQELSARAEESTHCLIRQSARNCAKVPTFDEVELEEQGTQLWNLCGRVRRSEKDAGGPRPIGKLLLFGRALAFFLLAVGNGSSLAKRSTVIRLLKVALRLVKEFLDANDPVFATPVAMQAAEYIDRLTEVGFAPSEEEEYHHLQREYFTVRVALSMLENQVEVAEHMFIKREGLARLGHPRNPRHSEEFSALLLHIGQRFLNQEDYALAVKWLDRASATLEEIHLERLSRGGIEKRLTIQQALFSALLGLNTPDGWGRAQDIVEHVQSEIGTKPVVLQLKLELLQKAPGECFDGNAYSSVLRILINTFKFSQSSFDLIMHHVRKLYDRAPTLASSLLDTFGRVLRASENDDWIGKVAINRVWMVTVAPEDSIETAQGVERFLAALQKPLAADVAVATQALMWKKVESNSNQKRMELAEKWCRLALHQAFQNCGPTNTSKLETKLLHCVAVKNNMDAVLSVWESISEQTRKEPLPAYIMFKAALQNDNKELVDKFLEGVNQASEDMNYPGACVAELQKIGDMETTAKALQKVVEGFHRGKPDSLHVLPVVYRCIIRLHMSVMDRAPPSEKSSVHEQELASTFASVIQSIESGLGGDERSTAFSADELNWFSNCAYQLGLKYRDRLDLRQTVRMFSACLAIMGRFPLDAGSQYDVVPRQLFSHFVLATTLCALARAQDQVERRQQDYSRLREHVQKFDDLVPLHVSNVPDEQARTDLDRKHAMLLAIDLEAALFLKQWDDLGGVIIKARPCKDILVYQAMADCLLQTKPPARVLMATMRKLTSEMRSLDKYDGTKQARYERCLFQATLELDDEQARDLLAEIVQHLDESQATWPEDELEWMATSAYNHGLDLWSTGRDKKAEAWWQLAMSVAHYGQDSKLEDVIQRQVASVRLGRATDD